MSAGTFEREGNESNVKMDEMLACHSYLGPRLDSFECHREYLNWSWLGRFEEKRFSCEGEKME